MERKEETGIPLRKQRIRDGKNLDGNLPMEGPEINPIRKDFKLLNRTLCFLQCVCVCVCVL